MHNKTFRLNKKIIKQRHGVSYLDTFGLSRIFTWGRTFGQFSSTTTWIASTNVRSFRYPIYIPLRKKLNQRLLNLSKDKQRCACFWQGGNGYWKKAGKFWRACVKRESNDVKLEWTNQSKNEFKLKSLAFREWVIKKGGKLLTRVRQVRKLWRNALRNQSENT